MTTSIDVAVVGTWLAVILSFVSLIGVIRSHLSSGTKENAEAIVSLGEKHGKLDSRVQRIESKLDYLPSKDDFSKLEISLTKIEGDMKLIAKTSKAAESSAQRVEDFLIKKGAQK